MNNPKFNIGDIVNVEGRISKIEHRGGGRGWIYNLDFEGQSLENQQMMVYTEIHERAIYPKPTPEQLAEWIEAGFHNIVINEFLHAEKEHLSLKIFTARIIDRKKDLANYLWEKMR